MISPEGFLSSLRDCGVSLFTGVPDSLLKEFLLEVQSKSDAHYICANEGASVALAAGHHLATGQLGLVYMQNSGLGNAVNPLTSLTHTTVFAIPMLLLIGWRGEPGVSDEPQHQAMGIATEHFLAQMQIPVIEISAQTDYIQAIKQATSQTRENSSPVALLCRKGAFAKASAATSPNSANNSAPTMKALSASKAVVSNMKREEALEIVTSQLKGSEAVVCTTGLASRELYEIRTRTQHSHQQDFLNVGAMGHCSLIALGVAMAPNSPKQVLCIDGDGSVMMHMGSMTTIGRIAPKGYKHIILNNYIHDSVGGQPTGSELVDLCMIGAASGYRSVARCAHRQELAQAVRALLTSDGPSLLEVVVLPGTRDTLSRPPRDFQEMKRKFMNFMSTATCDNVTS